MKNKHFYSHLVETTDITIELGNIDLTPQERVHLLSLVDANIHASVMDTVLSSLSEEDKKIFLRNLVANDHGKTWEHLKSKEAKIEEKVKNTIKEVNKELIYDIKAFKKKK